MKRITKTQCTYWNYQKGIARPFDFIYLHGFCYRNGYSFITFLTRGDIEL